MSISEFFNKHKKVIRLISVITIIAIIVLIYVFVSKTKENYNSYYNKLNKETILSILSKDCNLSLRDYVNILNSTNNLKTLFLQELCNNPVCSGYNPKNEIELFRLVKSISAQCVLKCIKNNDIYRLALVNLKINDMVTSVPHSFTHNFPIFTRSLTKGVYGVESFNVYVKVYKDGSMSSEQKSVKDIVNLYLEKLPKLQQTDQQISSLVSQHSLDQKDTSLYTSLVKDFVNKIQSSPRLLENKNNNSNDFSVDLFCIISSVTLLDLFLLPSLGC